MLARARILFYSRPLCRTCEIICNHAARLFEKNRGLARDLEQTDLNRLNMRRIDFQDDLRRIGDSHGQACSECKGKCCGGVRERDAFIDRILQDPQTADRNSRRLVGASPGACFGCATDGDPVEGHCTELTTAGCRIPYELRNIQCTAYFCKAAVNELSAEECNAGSQALAGLIKIELQTALLAFKSRCRRQKKSEVEVA